MSRLNAPQAIIFSVTFLGVSLIGNFLLFQSNGAREKEIDQQTQAITTLQEKLELDQTRTQTQTSRIDTMGGQQEELALFINQLQQEISKLQVDYRQTAQTAELTQQKLRQSMAQISTLTTALNEQKKKVTESQKTINNQQRLLRTKSSQGNAEHNDELQIQFAELSTLLFDEHPEISLTQTSSGDGVIDIPLDLFFEPNSLDLKQDIDTLLEPIVATLNNLPIAQILVIGHADARPIVSDMAKLYPTNWELSSIRASMVVRKLVESGVSDQHIIAAGKASNTPIRVEANEEAWKINRRIEIRVSF